MTLPRFLSAAALLLALAAPAAAQMPGLSGDRPLEIEAGSSLTWNRESRTYVATGGVAIRQGDTTLTAATVTAHYRERDGRIDIHRIEAEGEVRLANPTQTVTGARGTYDLDTGVVVFQGGTPTLTAPGTTVTARDELRYNERERLAVATGEAVAVRNGSRLQAERLHAYFAEGQDGRLALDRVEAEGNVVITTATDVARGNRATYLVGAEQARLEGDVKLTRGPNQLNGAVAEVNMRTGESRILAGGSGRVRGIIVPGQAPGGAGN